MITYVYGDLYNSPARVLVNPVNTVGTMSTGLAEDFKQVYPEMFAEYQTLCEADAFGIGQLFLYKTAHKWLLNFPTKKHYRAQSKIEYIEEGLQKIASTYAEQNYTSVSFPALGVNDGLDWESQVKPLMEAYLGTLPIMVYIHLPVDDPFQDSKPNITSISKWLNGTPETISFEIFWRGVSSIVRRHPELTTLDDHKRHFRLSFRSDEANRKLMNLKITPDDNEELFIPQSLLRDLWQYIVLAGYVLPQNLPGGLDAYGAELVALLGRLNTVKPIYLMPTDGEKVIGLQYIPPVERKEDTLKVDLVPTE